MTHKRWLGDAATGYILLGILSIGISSCGKKEVPQVKEWTDYQNAYGAELTYPKGWLLNDDANVIKIYPSPDIAQRFVPPLDPDVTNGIEFQFGSETFRNAGVGTIEAYKETTKVRLADLGAVGQEEPAMIGSDSAIAIMYNAKISSKSTIHGKRIITAYDSSFYYVNVEAFNDDFDLYKPIVDSMIESIRFPRPKPKTTNPNEAAIPLTETRRYTSDVLDIQYPENFECSFPEKKGETIFSMDVRGLRVDSDIMIDVLPAKKLTVDKVFDQNKGLFKMKTSGNATLDGNPAKYLTTSPASNIDRKVYFAVKNDKVYRIILTWYKPMTNDFLPAFEKAVASLKIK